MPVSTVKRERKQHREAYKLWAATSGGKATERAFAAVGKEIGFCSRTIQNWYVSFGWRGRFRAQLEEAQGITLEDLAKVGILDGEPLEPEDYRKIIAKLVRKFQYYVDNAIVSVSSIADFERIAKLDLAMQGKPTGDGAHITIITAIPRPGDAPHTAVIADNEIMLPAETGEEQAEP